MTDIVIGNRKMRDKVRAGPVNNKGRGVLAVGEMGMTVQISFQSGARREAASMIPKYLGCDGKRWGLSMSIRVKIAWGWSVVQFKDEFRCWVSHGSSFVELLSQASLNHLASLGRVILRGGRFV